MILSEHNDHLEIHGGTMAIDHCGLCITGPPNIGKSSLQLQLLDRGHLWVCDDITRVSLCSHQIIATASNPRYARWAEISPIGLCDLTEYFESSSFIEKSALHVVITLTDDTAPPPSKALHIKWLEHTLPHYILGARQPELPILLEILAKRHGPPTNEPLSN